MSKTKNYGVLKSAIEDFLEFNQLNTDYRSSFAWNPQSMVLAVFDPPADYIPNSGLLQDGPEYRAKPVLYAYMNPDGTVRVEETEFTQKYLYSAKALVAR